MSSFSRRSFLAAGGATLLAACGGGGGSKPKTAEFELAARWSNEHVLVPGVQRLAVSLFRDGAMSKTGPERLDGILRDANGKEVMSLQAARRSQGIEYPYWDFRANLATPGVYYLVVDGGPEDGVALQVFDRAQVAIPAVGTALPPFDTPTVSDHRGVDPYCSRVEGPCPLHDITLTEALATGRPVAYMIGTPAHCQTGTCAPGLEFLSAAHQRLGDRVAMVHADVYVSDDTSKGTTPAVQAIELSFEPVVFVTDAKGVVVDRLDAVWDQSELDEVLARVS